MTTSTITPPKRNPISWPATIWIGAFHVGALLAFVPAFFTWQALALCVFMHWVCGGVGICLTYHRLLTHRSYTPRFKFIEYVLVGVGCMASEGGPIGWVADHRRHHAHSDEELDVHTPHEGFWWSHMMWWVTPESDTEHTHEYYNRWAPDLVKDPVLVWFDKYFIAFPIANAVLFYAIGGMPWLVWGSFVGTVVTLHSTWLVNSATHVWGYRSHKTRDDSTNLWWVALLTYGEGWHNNHHAFQTSARHGLRWWEFDVTYMMIRTMKALGLVHSVKLPRYKLKGGAAEVSPAVMTAARTGQVVAVSAQEEPELVGARV